jgi:hypothetical protein
LVQGIAGHREVRDAQPSSWQTIQHPKEQPLELFNMWDMGWWGTQEPTEIKERTGDRQGNTPDGERFWRINKLPKASVDSF